MSDAWKTDGEKQMYDDLLRLAQEDGCVAAGFAIEKIEKLEDRNATLSGVLLLAVATNAKQREALELARPIVEKQTRCKLELIGNQIRAREALAKIDEAMPVNKHRPEFEKSLDRIAKLETENAKQRELLKRWHHEADGGALDGVDLELLNETYEAMGGESCFAASTNQ